MSTFLFAQGLDPVQLAEGESFNKARHRANKALALKTNLENQLDDAVKKYDPMHLLTFKTVDDEGNIGRISINPDKFIGVGSDEAKDAGSAADDDEE